MPYAPLAARGNTREALLFLLLHLSTRRGEGGVVVLLVVAIRNVDDEEHKDEEHDVPRFPRASASEIIVLLSSRVVVFPTDAHVIVIVFCGVLLRG